MRTDLRYAVRSFRRQPGFTVAVLATLGLGIGASTAMFSVLNAVLLKPLPHANAERVVRVYQPNDDSRTTGLSPLEIAEVRETARSIDDIVEYHSMPFTFVGGSEAQRLQTGVVSASYFAALGIAPIIGRDFLPGEDQPGAEPVLLLAHSYWQREFGGDPGVVGMTLQMNDRTHTVVGVLPPFPPHAEENAVYMPTSSCPFRSGAGWAENRSARGLTAFALLRQTVARDAALQELRAISATMQNEHAAAYPAGVRFDVALVPLHELLARPARATILLLLAATIMLLAIVCSNFGNLMIVRVMRRDSEMAVRLALGASRVRLLRQLLTESALLAAVGGAIGVVVALASTGMLAAFTARFTPRAADVRVDTAVLFFAIAATAVTALVAGLLPVSALRSEVAATLRKGGGRHGSARGQARTRNVLIVVQVAISLTLAAGAGALVRTLVERQRADMGFDPAGVMTARLDLNWTRYDTADRVHTFYRELEAALAQTAGVAAVGIGSNFPLNGDPLNTVRFAVHADEERDNAPAVAALTASAGYFAALGVPLLRGRVFDTADDNPGTEPAVVITRSLAQRYWPGADAVGQRVSLDGGENWWAVVGVIGDMRHGLESDFEHLAFVPHNRFGGFQSRIVLRSHMPAAAVERLIRDAAASIDPQQPVTEIVPLAEHRGDRLAPYRLTALLLLLFATIAVGVTAVGLGGTIAFSVAQRTREIGIRIAIGAGPGAVLRAVLAQVAGLALLGIAAGGALAFLGLRRLSAAGGVTPGSNGLTVVVVSIIVLAIIGVAGMIPARRAIAIPAARALQND